MNLSAKHEQKNIKYGNFTGGLSTSAVPEMISENQLAECVNMEFNKITGALQACCGTVMIFKPLANVKVDKIFYDEINNVFLFTDKITKKVYTSRMTDMTGTDIFDCINVGILSGNKKPSAVIWENGLIIASGGKLQYWDGSNLNIITGSPNNCNGIFVKNGRLWTWFDYTLMCSAVGDENDWKIESSDDSSAKYIEVGYKEGEWEYAFITGVCALSSDIVIIKNDGKIYRLAGDYPDWSLNEIARNITCLNECCYSSIQDSVFVVSHEGMFLLETTVDYGDIKPTNIANNIVGLLGILSDEETYIKYLPSLNQIWIYGSNNSFIVYDLTFKAFFQRQFNSVVNDVCIYKEYYLLSRENKVTELMPGVFYDEAFSDDEDIMKWKITVKSYTSFYEFLLKRIRMFYVPLMDSFSEAFLITANGKINIPLPPRAITSPLIFGDTSLIWEDNSFLFQSNTHFVTHRMIYRNEILGVTLKGKGSAIMINNIEATIVEV